MSDRQVRDGTTAPTVRRGTVPSVDTLFEVLASPQRRFVLSHLSLRDVVSVDDLARELAAEESHPTVADATDEARGRFRTTLYHVHLPKLASAGLLDYDCERGTVELRETIDAAEPFLALTERS